VNAPSVTNTKSSTAATTSDWSCEFVINLDMISIVRNWLTDLQLLQPDVTWLTAALVTTQQSSWLPREHAHKQQTPKPVMWQREAKSECPSATYTYAQVLEYRV